MLESAFSRRFANFWGCPRVIIPRIFTPGPSTTLPQPPGRYPTHPGPIMTSQLLLEGDLGPETCQNRLFRAILTPKKNVFIAAFRIYPRSLQDEHLRLPHGSEMPTSHPVCYSEVEQIQIHASGPLWPNIGQIFGQGCPLGSRPKLKKDLEASKNSFFKKFLGIFLVTAFLNTY